MIADEGGGGQAGAGRRPYCVRVVVAGAGDVTAVCGGCFSAVGLADLAGLPLPAP